MTAEEFPADLVDLQRSFLAAEARCTQIADSHPKPTDVAAGRAEITDEQHTEFSHAMNEAAELARQLEAHWATVPPEQRTKARAALREAARQ